MSVLVANNATSILASGISSGATSLIVNAGDGAKFPALAAPDFFFATLISASNPAVYEIVRVTARATDTFTVVRGQDGTTAQAFSASDIVVLLPTRATVNASRNYVSLPTSTGSANAQLTVNTTPFLAAPAKGAVQSYIPGFTNTAAMTFGSDGFTPAAVLAWGQACQGGEVVAGIPVTQVFDGTSWNIINPGRDPGYAAGSGTNTITATLPGIPVPYNGAVALVKHANTSTGNTTLNGYNVYVDQGGVTRDPGGLTVGGGIGVYVFNSSFNSGAGGWQLTNPQRATGSVTGTPTGFSGSPGTCTINYFLLPDAHTLYLIIGTGISGTSNSASFTITGLPSFVSPSITQAYVINRTDNSATGTGSITLTASSNVLTLGVQGSYATGLFTTSGLKAFPVGGAATISFQI